MSSPAHHAIRARFRTLHARFCFVVSLAIVSWSGAAVGDEQRERLWKAVRGGDVEEVSRLLESGTDVDSPSEIGITTLWLAASNGRLEVAERLIEQGADVNARDAIWYQTPLSAAASANHLELVKRLIDAGAEDLNEVAFQAATADRHEVLRLLLDTERIARDTLDGALFASADKPTITMMLREAGADSLSPLSTERRESWMPLAGSYENDNGRTITVQVHEFGLVVVPSTGSPMAYRATEQEGNLIWNRDLSSIDSSFSIDKDYEWGFASSPIIHHDLVILQLDLSRDSMIVAYRLEDGSRVWATQRDEIPSWSTPVVAGGGPCHEGE